MARLHNSWIQLLGLANMEGEMLRAAEPYVR